MEKEKNPQVNYPLEHSGIPQFISESQNEIVILKHYILVSTAFTYLHCNSACFGTKLEDIKVVPVLPLTEHHAIKPYWGSGGTDPHIL
jgi:hypothetical protein